MKELEITRKGAEAAFGYQWFRFGDTYLRYRYTSDTTTEVLGIDPPAEIVRIGSFAFLSTVDTRDSSTFAHSGMLARFSYESAAPAYGGSVKYAKTGLSVQQFVPFGDRHTFVLEATGGLGSGTLPYQEKYGIGGADNLISTPLMGYERREFTGDQLMAFSAAYRLRLLDYQLSLVKAFYLNTAYQAGNVWDTRQQMAMNDLRAGISAGLHADTIVGPMRFDFARGEQNRWAVTFSAGFDF
jgi:outer membrane protein assembly factor BamA